MTEERQILLLGLAALFHAARLTNGKIEKSPDPGRSFGEARDFLNTAAEHGIDLDLLLKGGSQ